MSSGAVAREIMRNIDARIREITHNMLMRYFPQFRGNKWDGDAVLAATSSTVGVVEPDNISTQVDTNGIISTLYAPVAVMYNYWLGSMSAYSIGLGLSANGRYFARVIEPAISPGAGGTWDNKWVKDPCLVIPAAGGPLYCYYRGQNSSNVAKIGLAISYDGGNTWTKSASNPILTPSASWEGGASGYLSFPAVLYDLTETNSAYRWKMWYAGGTSPSDGSGGIGYAYSSDGLTWTKYASNPVLVPTGTGWEQQQIIPGAIAKIGTTYSLFYGGLIANNNPWQSGLVTFTTPTGSYARSSNNPLLVGDGISSTLTSSISIGDTTLHVTSATAFPVGCPLWIYDDPSYTSYYLTYVTAQPTSTTLAVADLAPITVSVTNGVVASVAKNSVVIRAALYDGGWQFAFAAFDPDINQSQPPELSMLAYADTALSIIRIDHSAGLIARPTLAEAQSPYALVSLENPSIAPLTDTWRRFLAAPSTTIAVFGASGPGHSTGIVPDPGSTTGTTRYLREDATFAVPPGTIIYGPISNGSSTPLILNANKQIILSRRG